MRVLLISTYELGRQPFGLASPAAWLKREGLDVVCADASRHKIDDDDFRAADVIAFYLSMHTATRLAAPLIERARTLNPGAKLVAYGLYAPLNAGLLRSLGVAHILGGEFEAPLVEVVRRSGSGASEAGITSADVSLGKLQFIVPERSGLPPLPEYARLAMPDGSERICGYTEATRGCKHLCRHCPIVPVYQGAFRVVQHGVVLADIRQQAAAGAEHITFGDPDFFNGPSHAVALVRDLHAEFPQLSYDVTIKIEHLLQHADLLPVLRETGCAFVVSAVESVDDHVLELLAKGHTRDGFLHAAQLCREAGLPLAPTFVAFTPWTTLDAYLDLLNTVEEAGLIEHVAPVQWTLRLLITSGSRLLELHDVQRMVGAFDRQGLCYRWAHPDPRVDALQRDVEARVQDLIAHNYSRRQIFECVRALAAVAAGAGLTAPMPPAPDTAARATIPYLSEPWYC